MGIRCQSPYPSNRHQVQFAVGITIPSGADYDLVNASKIRQPTIWQRLSEAGYRVGVLNVPVTYPPRPLNGFMVSGILSPKGGDICYPKDLMERHRRDLGEYRVAPNIQYKPAP